MEEKFTGRNIALTDTDRTIVTNLMAKSGINSFSNAVRIIIREWNDIATQRVSLTEAGRKALEDCKEG